MSDSLQALFRPDRLAVIGASAKPEKMGFTIFKNILDAGFGGQVTPVNPKGETILGVPSVKSVDEIPPGTGGGQRNDSTLQPGGRNGSERCVPPPLLDRLFGFKSSWRGLLLRQPSTRRKRSVVRER